MKNLKLYALVGVLTAANIGFRVASAEQGPDGARLVSHIEAGQKVESAALQDLLARSPTEPGACQVVVAFNPDCPICQRAERLERLAGRTGSYGRTLWVTDEERARLPGFVEGLPSTSQHVVDPDVFDALDVEAVPALFLFDAAGTVRWVGPYRGDESGEELAERCQGPSAPILAGADEATEVPRR